MVLYVLPLLRFTKFVSINNAKRKHMDKKLLFVIAFLFSFAFSHAEWNVTTEVQNKKVLVEEFTGIHCGYCPYAHAIVAELLKAQPDKVYAIAFHTGSFAVPGSDEPDYRLSKSAVINDYFGITGYPSGMINRQRFTDYIICSRTMWAAYAHMQSQEVAPVNLWMASSYDSLSRELTIDIEGYYTADVDADFNLLNVMVTENNVMGPQRGGGLGDEYIHQHMIRGYVTDTWGDTITNCKKGEYFSRQYKYVVPEKIHDVELNPAEFEVVVFLSENEENVLNVTGCRPEYPGLELPLAADISEALLPIADTYGYDYFELALNNKSTDEITKATFKITLNSVEHTVEWTGSVAPRSTSYIQVPLAMSDELDAVSNRYAIELTGLNGVEYKGNKLAGKFAAPYSVTPTVRFEIKTDEYADENRFLIKDMSGNVVYELGAFPVGQVVFTSQSVTLAPNTQYCLEVTDAWSNGIMEGRVVMYDAYNNVVCEENAIENHGCRIFFTTADRNVSTEIENKKALIEEFTGIYCGNCPDAHVIIEELLKAQPDNLIALAYHAGHYAYPHGAGDPDYRTALGDTLDSYFVPDGYPNGMINRVAFEGDGYMYSRGIWASCAHAITDQEAPVNIWLNSVYDSNTRTLTIDVEGYYTADVDAATNRLNVVVTQSNIVGPQNGSDKGDSYIHEHMVRANITPIWGDAIESCKQGDFFKKQYVYVVPNDINGVATDPANFQVVAFVAKDKTDVLNVAACRPDYPGLELPLDVEIEAYRLPVKGGTYGYNYYEAYLKNNSTQLISSAQFVITLNDEKFTAEWVGEVKPRSTAYIMIPFKQSELLKASNDYVVKLVGVNAVAYAGNSFDGSFQDPIETTPDNKFVIKTDEYADENQYIIKDVNGKIVHTFGPYPAGVVSEVTETLKLTANKVYTLEITDAWGNGIMSPRGSCKIYNADGKLVLQQLEIKDHGCRMAINTTAESSVHKVLTDNTFTVRYNKAAQAVVVTSQQDAAYAASLYNAAGQCVATVAGTQELSMPVQAQGIYLVEIVAEATREVVKVAVR